MNRSHRASLIALAVLAMAGCTGMHQKSTTVAKNWQVDDQAYIARVEHTARNRGVSVRWVNPPQKRVKASQQ